jgi:hypothetical protein
MNWKQPPMPVQIAMGIATNTIKQHCSQAFLLGS